MALLDAISQGPFMRLDWTTTTDPGWDQYLDDHVSVIQQSCIDNKGIVHLTADMIDTVRYSLPQYLRYHGYEEGLAWIIRKINDIPNDWYFDYQKDGNPPVLYIPTVDLMNLHYNNYIASKDIQGA